MTNYTYNPSIPAAANNPSDDQEPMQTNYASIAGILNIDMVGFGDNNGGYHKQITYVDQGADPGSAASQYRTYSKLVGGSSELFAQKDAIATPIQLTSGVPVAAPSGWTYLPGGLILQWGTVTIGGSSGTANFARAFPSFVYIITLGANVGATMWTSSSSLTSVTISRSGSGASSCQYMAIGI
jgi:hypothetical protein